MKTFAQLQNDVFTQLKEEKGDAGFWTEQEVKDAINDTYIDIAQTAKCFRQEKIIEIRNGIRFYKLPENYVYGSVNRVEFNNEIILPALAAELDSHSITWRSDTGAEILNYIEPGNISQFDEIGVYPLPDSDGTAYNLASTTKDDGVIVAVYDDSYEEFTQENGTIIATSGDANFSQSDGIVLEIQTPTDNLKVFHAKYPKLLYNDHEVFLPPISYNPQKIITKGSLSILFGKDGEGKDIQKASFYTKRYNEARDNIEKPKVKRMHRMRSITDMSHRGRLSLGQNYPFYRAWG